MKSKIGLSYSPSGLPITFFFEWLKQSLNIALYCIYPTIDILFVLKISQTCFRYTFNISSTDVPICLVSLYLESPPKKSLWSICNNNFNNLVDLELLTDAMLYRLSE